MNVLIADRYFKPDSNEYTKNLADAYIRNGYTVIVDDQNFVFSNFVPDVLHLQWPEALYRWHKYVSADDNGLKLLEYKLAELKRNKCIVLYTVHNMQPHNTIGDIDKRMYKMIMNYVDIFIHHGNASIRELHAMYPMVQKAQHIVAPHGEYSRLKEESSYIARKYFRLPQDKYIITNFGQIRPNKGETFFKEIIRSFSRNYFFMRIGKPVNKENKIRRLVKNLASNSKVLTLVNNSRTISKALTNSKIPLLMSATDVFFLSHTSGMNSGIIPHAITYGKPLVFPDIGNLKEQANGWEWFETYTLGDKNSAVNAIKKLFVRLLNHNPGDFKFDNEIWLSCNSWDVHIKIIDNAIHNFLQSGNMK